MFILTVGIGNRCATASIVVKSPFDPVMMKGIAEAVIFFGVEMTCTHENAVFMGQFSLVGNYVCPDCQAVIDPVEFSKLRGHLHIMLIDYYTAHPDRLDPMWRDHPWVEHLYVES